MASKKFYSDDDIQLAKAALSELPDLTAQRKTLRDFLDAIRDDIIVLVRTKGYTLADVRDTLKNAGYEVGEKALRDIIREAESKKPSRRSSSKTAPKKTDSGRKDGIDKTNTGCDNVTSCSEIMMITEKSPGINTRAFLFNQTRGGNAPG